MVEPTSSLTAACAPARSGRACRRRGLRRRRAGAGAGRRRRPHRRARASRSASSPIPTAAILCGVSDGKTLADRRRRRPRRRDRAPTAAREAIADEKGRWIDALALRGGAIAWSAGKQVRARDETGAVKTWSAPTTARGLAFQPKGYRLAVAHYNGVSLWFPKVEGAPQLLEWKGAHLDATVLARRALSRHLDAGERAAWLAARRLAQHAHDRLSRPRRARSPGRTTATGSRPRAPTPRRLAVQGQGRADGQGAARMRRARGAGRPRSRFIRRRSSSPSATPTASSCCAASPTRRKFWCARPGGGPVSALGWDADGRAPAVRPRSRRRRPADVAGVRSAKSPLPLGRRFINLIQIRAAASLTRARSLASRFSKRAAAARECLSLLKKRSTRLRRR